MRWLTLLAVLCCASGAGADGREQEQRFTLIQNDEAVGWLVAQRSGRRVAIDYHVDSNGRGPKHRETLTLDEAGLPLAWDLRGTSLMGAEVEEHFSYREGVARWRSQADRGQRTLDAPRPYVINDGSPWASGLYVRQLLAAPERELAVLPAGTMRLRSFPAVSLGEGEARRELTPYQVIGVSLRPGYVFLDRERALFATVSGHSVMVREGNERLQVALREQAEQLAGRQLSQRQQALAHRYPGPVAVVNVKVFDPRAGTVGDPVTVTVEDERITAIKAYAPGTPAAQGTTVIDGGGAVLVPGLHDMHSHSTGLSGLFYLAAGVTSTRDLGNNNDALAGLRRRIAAGEIAGPRISPAGFIEGRSPYSARHGIIADKLPDALAAVDWYADRDYMQIKLYNSIDPDWVAPLAERAHSRGLRLTGHIPAFGHPDRSIRDGYDEIAHINQLMLGWLLEDGEDTRTPLRLTAMARAADLDLQSPAVRDTLALMREHDIALDTTAVILERLMLSRAGEVADGDRDYLSHMPIGYQRYRQRTFVPLETEADSARYESAFRRILETIALLHREGITLLPGTDDTTGFTLHRELELYTLAGIPAADVVRMATLDAARYLGTDAATGTLEVGKLADFLMVDGDPGRDITALKAPQLVMRGGVVYFPGEIYRELGIEPFAARPSVRSARAEDRHVAP